MGIELVPALVLIAGGMAAGFINVIAAGGSLITMPLLIFLGIPPTSANGTVRIAILVQGITATLRFHRSGVINWKEVPKLVVPVWIGAIGGAIVASNMADTNFKAMIGWITLVAGAIWAEHAWGRYWGWDTKEVWTFIIWVIYAGYIHARATRGWRGSRSAWLQIVGLTAILFNFTVVNLFFKGLHAYSGL